MAVCIVWCSAGCNKHLNYFWFKAQGICFMAKLWEHTLTFFLQFSHVTHILSHNIYIWWRLNGMSFDTKLACFAERTKKVTYVCDMCVFAHISLLLFIRRCYFFIWQTPKTACKLHRKRQNRTALTYHNPSQNMWVRVYAILIFHK